MRKMLTDKQERFALNVFNGMSNIDAYKDSYDCENMSDNAISVEASRLLQNPKVSLRLTELRDKAAESRIMTAKERLIWLSEVVKDKEQSMNDRLKASDQMNKMQGEYVQKIEADVNNEVTITVELVDDEE